jgi:esterase/lipase superfamily enzyme
MIAAITNRPEYLDNGAELAYLQIEDGQAVHTSAGNMRRLLLKTLRQRDGAGRIVAFIHGYNTSLGDSVEMLRTVDANITARLPNALTVGFLWPSEGRVGGYISDRNRARQAAPSLCNVIMQTLRFLESTGCSAELCVVAHSMGNFVLAEAARYAWETLGMPLTYNAFSEILMVAPDLDGGAFEASGEANAIAVFGRRVTVYHSRRDHVLLASSVKRAGLTGSRLGRQGPDSPAIPKNVVAIDATMVATHETVNPHSAYFHAPATLDDMVAVLSGIDRSEFRGRLAIGGNAWKLMR